VVQGEEQVLDKLQKVMKADVGSLVKDAGKVLNTDVGSIAKGAGKVLNADVGDIVSGTKKLLNTDLTDLFTGDEQAGEAGGAPKKIAGTMPTKPAEAAQRADDDGPPTAPGDMPGAQSSPGPNTISGPAQPAQTRLTEDIAVRKDYERPYGQEISNLLPINVGEFSRPPNEPSGTLATDPARAFYAGGGAKLEVEVGSYWDSDEALERIQALQGKCASSKPSPDGMWMVGKSDKGLTFAWMREQYVFAVTTQDAAALIRFLKTFPY
jgi:hypothetical protein